MRGTAVASPSLSTPPQQIQGIVMTNQPGAAHNPNEDGPGFAMPQAGGLGQTPPQPNPPIGQPPISQQPQPPITDPVQPAQPSANPQPWAQPGYGQQPYWQQPPQPPVNGLAIGALVAAFVAAPVGLVLGIVALIQINRSSGAQGGKGLAIAAICVGGFLTLAVIGLPLIILLISGMTSGVDGGVGAMSSLL